MAKNALLYHTEIDFGVDLGLLNREFNWAEVKKRFKAAVVEPKKVFEVKKGPEIKVSKDEVRPNQQLRKGRRM